MGPLEGRREAPVAVGPPAGYIQERTLEKYAELPP